MQVVALVKSTITSGLVCSIRAFRLVDRGTSSPDIVFRRDPLLARQVAPTSVMSFSSDIARTVSCPIFPVAPLISTFMVAIRDCSSFSI